MDTVIEFFHDKRRIKSCNSFPLKLRIYDAITKKAKLFKLGINLTPEEFCANLQYSDPKKQLIKQFDPKTLKKVKETRILLQQIETKANEIVKNMDRFTFESFEKKMFRRSGEGGNILYHIESRIEDLKAHNHFNTATVYNSCYKSLLKFGVYKTGRIPTRIPFIEITPKFLNDYQDYMVKHLKRSVTTVSMYVSVIATMFNAAIEVDKDIDREIYPFGKRKYVVPSVKNVKKTLNKEQFQKLRSATPKTPEQEKARDFWLFSFINAGMNIKDIALLKFESIGKDKLIFYRAKTAINSNPNQKPITIPLTELTRSIIKKYGNKKTSPKSYVFPILEPDLPELTKNQRINNFTRFINQNIQKLAKDISIPPISTYWARHSFAAFARKKGMTLESISAAFGHSNIKTTMIYLDSLDEDNDNAIWKDIASY